MFSNSFPTSHVQLEQRWVYLQTDNSIHCGGEEKISQVSLLHCCWQNEYPEGLELAWAAFCRKTKIALQFVIRGRKKERKKKKKKRTPTFGKEKHFRSLKRSFHTNCKVCAYTIYSADFRASQTLHWRIFRCVFGIKNDDGYIPYSLAHPLESSVDNSE